MKKRLFAMMLTGVVTAGLLTGCGSNNSANNAADANAAGSNTAESNDTDEVDDSSSDFDAATEISVVSREDGSGTRGAFVELFGVEQKDENGEKVDYTTDEAIISNSTEVVLQSVAGDAYAIGYVSLGSLNDSVNAVSINGAAPSVETIKDGSYTISRPFNIATKEDVSAAAQDFINYIMSADGQQVIEEKGYISAAEGEAFTTDGSEGKVVVAGSSSVTPVMEKLIEAYSEINTAAEIEIQESDSTTGMTNTIDGICDIGMASRELKDSELESGITGTTIAMDGIAVIVNKACPVKDLTPEQVMNIYTGESTTWDAVVK